MKEIFLESLFWKDLFNKNIFQVYGQQKLVNNVKP